MRRARIHHDDIDRPRARAIAGRDLRVGPGNEIALGALCQHRIDLGGNNGAARDNQFGDNSGIVANAGAQMEHTLALADAERSRRSLRFAHSDPTLRGVADEMSCAGCEYLRFADNQIAPLLHQRSRFLPQANLSVDLLARCTDQGTEILLR